MRLNKRACRKLADPTWKMNLNSGLFCADQLQYIVRSAVRNVDHQRVLILYVYDREQVNVGETRPLWTVFQSREQYITLARREDGAVYWRKAAFDNLSRQPSFRNKCAFYSLNDEKKVMRFCKEDKKDGFACLDSLQSRIMHQSTLQRRHSKQRKIIERMETVPGLPRGLKSWIHKEIMPVYIFYTYSKGAKEMVGYCTACRRSVKVSGIKHNTCLLYTSSIITGPPGSGKTSAIKAIIEVFRILCPKGIIMLMAPTGRASRRMVESTGFEEASTLHSGLSVISEEDESCRKREPGLLDADLIIVDEVSLVDMWLMSQFFKRLKRNTKIVLVGDVNQLPSVGAGNVLYEMIHCGLIPVTVLDEIFRQDKDSSIPYNARLINQGCTKLHDGSDFTFISSVNQVKAAEVIAERYCQEIEENGIEQVQILSPFREDGAASAAHLNAVIRERVNPFCSTEDEIHSGTMSFRVGDRIMQTKNTEHVSNGDLGFIRYVKDTPEGKRIGMDFGVGRELEYGIEDLSHIELSYATTVHKAMGSEFPIILIPILEAHKIMLYRNLLYTAVTRAKTKVILVGQKSALLTAIHRNGNNKRNTLLGHRIRLYYRAFAKSAGIPIPADLEELELKNAG